jgi:hypothetical protein
MLQSVIFGQRMRRKPCRARTVSAFQTDKRRLLGDAGCSQLAAWGSHSMQQNVCRKFNDALQERNSDDPDRTDASRQQIAKTQFSQGLAIIFINHR